jgi:sucrose phosphorylase
VVRDQIALIRLRNTSPAFGGELQIHETEPHRLHMTWTHPDATATLQADLRSHGFTVTEQRAGEEKMRLSFGA